LSLEGHRPDSEGVHIVMAALEVGKIPGLKTTDGKPLDSSAGGISTVLNDVGRYFSRFLANKNRGKLTIIGMMMDGMSNEGMKPIGNVFAKIEGRTFAVEQYEYQSPDGAKYIFLDHEKFKRLTATPEKGKTIYNFRGLEDGTSENKLEEQRIWSLLNQSIAQVFAEQKGTIYVPHDYHTSPATFYIHKKLGLTPISAKPLVHNELYLGNYQIAPNESVQRQIWNLTPREVEEYFRHDDELIMLAPAVRLGEQNEIFSAMSVSEGSAKEINRKNARIDFFGRVQGLTNGLGEENRPHLSDLLKPKSEEELIKDGIKNEAVLKRFSQKGFSFGQAGQSDAGILRSKAEAKEALQLNLGLTIDSKKPLFVGFARFVYQKGMGFVAQNIRHILDSGGQVVVGGPVGDSIGEAERAEFLILKTQLEREGHPNARNFVFVDGAVKGGLKGLFLAGGDFFMIPSRYEPCGLTDCEALYNGTIPIAHFVGGLSKGKNTILYGPSGDHGHGFALGEGINEAFREYSNLAQFQQRQLAAMKESFSVEKNFDLFMQTNRLEVYGKMLRELERLKDQHLLSPSQASAWMQEKIVKAYTLDMPQLIEALRMLHPSRRSSLMNELVASL